MIGTILQKPVSTEDFRAAMEYCAEPAHNARLLEYRDRYEVAEKPAVSEQKAEVATPEPTLEERVEALEKAIAALTKGEEKK